MSARHTFVLSLTVRSPFMFRGLASGFAGVDTAQLRDERGLPIIPSDQIRGVIREALTDLVSVGALEAAKVLAWFGAPSADNAEASGEADRPVRGQLIFSDLTAQSMRAKKNDPDQPMPSAGSADFTRIMIDDQTGAAALGALQVIELVAPFGALVSFTGQLVIFAAEEEASAIAKTFGQALKLISSIGAFKSAGFGEIDSVEFRADGKPSSLPLPPATSGSVRRLYRVTFDRPLLVNAEKIASNAFQGAYILPGGVFKAALARRIELAGDDPQSGELGETLAALSFSHAMPESDELGRWLAEPLPLSMVATKSENRVVYGDAANLALDRGAVIRGEAAAFQPDWKSTWFDGARIALGRPKGQFPPLLARTHTKIVDGVADDSQLYTTIALAARRRNAEAAPYAWLVVIDTSRCTKEDTANRFVAAIEQGLDGIGKTDARASFELVGDAPPPKPKPVFGQDRRHIVVLTSDALLVDPVASTTPDGTRWNVTAHEAYATYWKKVLPGATLVNAFTKERWAGAYLSFRRRPYGGESYHPFLVTEAGSTFVINDADPEQLQAFCQAGLPLVELSRADPLDWRNCPFVPENGFGRIRADHCSDANTAKLLEVEGV